MNDGDDAPLNGPHAADQTTRLKSGTVGPLESKHAVSSQPSGVNERPLDRAHEKQEGPTVTLTSPSPRSGGSVTALSSSYPSIRPEAITAMVYDIVPTIAAPHSTSINTITATPDLRWVFSGGSDGYIRKFNWVDTANGKLMLTVAQRHPFVDSVTKAGILTSYWENEDPHGKCLLSSLSHTG